MPRVLLTAGPTREYLDDVRYLSNASSGRMGYALAEAARDVGWDVLLVSGPVELAPPDDVEVVDVLTTDQMRDACDSLFPDCDGVIAAAAVCDYRPRDRVAGKLSKTGGPITIEMIETDDVLARLGRSKRVDPLSRQWVVGFALEAQNPRENALQKLRRKHCDLIVLNHPTAIGAVENSVEVLADDAAFDDEVDTHSVARSVAAFAGTKADVASQLVTLFGTHFG